MKPQRIRDLLIIGLLWLPATDALAAFLYAAPIGVSAGNRNPGGSISTSWLDLVTSGPVNSINDSYSFTGLAGNGSTQTMTFSVDGAADASAAGLRTRISASIDNLIYNPANIRYVDDGLNGVPDYFSANFTARYSDTVHLTVAAGTVSSVILDFTITGDISPTGPANAWVQAWRVIGNSSIGMGGTQTFGNAGSGVNVNAAYQATFTANANGTVDLGLALQNVIAFSLYSGAFTDMADYAVMMDFFNTLDITGIRALDSAGQELVLLAAAGDSGIDYLNLTAVPVPAALPLLASGLAGLLAVARRRSV